MKRHVLGTSLKTAGAARLALLLALSLAASARDGAAPAVLPASAALPACLPSPSLGADGGRRYDGVIVRHARKRGLDPRLVKAVIAAESQFSPGAVSRGGARGLMQVMPATAEDLGFGSSDLSDPETNISIGTEYLARLFKTARRRPGGKRATRARVVRGVLAAYHSGPAALNGGVWSEPTRRYVRKVLSCYGSETIAAPAPRKSSGGFAAVSKKRREGSW
jgi:soluble lytic murein transglycosylase-like protein